MLERLESVRVVFSLRDPIDRLCSWYRFARSSGRIGGELDLRGYVERQRRGARGPVAGEREGTAT